ncbi:MAG: UDP-N-acetylmuramoyl-L-alanine--D-glutamate ligase [Candidatus Moranbacteria bacterium]|nr:UDP-N-acetylmuramoyl-L-alanine--D-glutamate ligase [Candidatus Moranbacteria bacterium]
MKKSELKGKRVTVFGLGLNEGGVGTVEFLEHAGVREIIVTDAKKREDLMPSIKRLSAFKNITFVLGQHRREDFIRTDLVVKNPGIQWSNEYVRLALSKGIPVESDSGIFFENCGNPIIGITGTKGKTTTASMIAHILRETGHGVVPVGVSQVPVLGSLGKIRPKDTIVFELSSWRLSGLATVKRSPHIAVFTNFFPDHLNYYRDMKSYRKDKNFIYRYQKRGDILIIGDQVELSEGETVSEVIRVSATAQPLPKGVFFRGDVAVIVRDEKETTLFVKSDLKNSSEQYLADALAAAAAALVHGVPAKKIATALRSFPGVPHRLEFAGESGGIFFYNDSAATVPEAAIAAIRSFPTSPILIAGGTDKKLPFESFADSVVSDTKRTILLKGTATDRLLREIRKRLPDEDVSERFPVVSSMQEAVDTAVSFAESGDVILLSPGATSFGIFRNEFDRGERFLEAVKKIGVTKRC